MRFTELRIAALIVAASIAAGGCSPMRIAPPVRGSVVDGATGSPVPDALVEMWAHSYTWLGMGHPGETYLQETWSSTDSSGHFSVGGGVSLLFPLWLGWTTRVAVVAPGYFPASVPIKDSVGVGFPLPRSFFASREIRLERMHYVLELESFTRFRGCCDVRGAEGAHRQLVERLHRLPLTRIGPPGVFVTQTGAAFDRVAVAPGWGLILARDSRSGRTFGWTSGGIAAPERDVEQWLAHGGWEAEARREKSDVAIDPFRQRSPAYRRAAAGTLHCAPAALEAAWLVDVDPTACANLGDASYLSSRHGGIRRFVRHLYPPPPAPIQEDLGFWEATEAVLRTAEGRKTFLDLCAGSLRGARAVVYGVAGEDAIYRFSEEGQPDQRIDF